MMSLLMLFPVASIIAYMKHLLFVEPEEQQEEFCHRVEKFSLIFRYVLGYLMENSVFL